MAQYEGIHTMQTSIENCQSCHAVCLATIAQCLEMGGEHAAAGNIRTLQDCVQICNASADYMLRNSDFHPQICGVCAEICERCAVNCESLAVGNDFMAQCAATCRKCAESCRHMSTVAAKSATM
jgi:hypothetical protein